MPRNHRRALYAKQSEINILDWACGPTSAFTCLKLLGNRNVTLSGVLRAAGMGRWNQEWENLRDWLVRIPFGQQTLAGSTEDMLVRAVRRYGYSGTIFKTGSLSRLRRKLRDLGEACQPCVLSASGGGHWVTAYGADDRGVWVLDPDRFQPATYELDWDEGKEWLWDEHEDGYGLIVVSPQSAQAKAFWRAGGFPASNPLLEGLDDEQFEDAFIALRDDLDAILATLHRGSGTSAGDAFAALSGTLEETVRDWCAGTDPAWLRRWMGVAGDILAAGHYRLSARDLPGFAIQMGALAAASALQAHEVAQGEGCDFESYWTDAELLLDRSRSGLDASAVLAEWTNQIAATAAGWCDGFDLDGADEDLRCLVGQGYGQSWKVATAEVPSLLADAAAMVTAYGW